VDTRSNGQPSSNSEFEFDDSPSISSGTTSEEEPSHNLFGGSNPDGEVLAGVSALLKASCTHQQQEDKTNNGGTEDAKVPSHQGQRGTELSVLSEVSRSLEPLQEEDASRLQRQEGQLVPLEEDPRLLQLQEGQLVPPELDLLYEGFQEGSDAARLVEEVADAQAIHQMGALPRISFQPQVLENLPSPCKRPKYSTKKDFVAVGPMVKAATKARRTREVATEVLEAVLTDSATVCVSGDACLCPGGSSSLIDLEKCSPCSEYKLIGHYICLCKRRNQ
jgi:hypothetical protein